MSEKQLWQIDWIGGQTDSDVGKNTVKEVLNVEINVPGQLNVRDVLQSGGATAGTNGGDPLFDYAYLNVNKEGTGNFTVFALAADLISIAPEGSISVELDIPGGAVGAGSYLTTHGDKVYLVAIRSGEPAGVYVVWHLDAGTRFRAPKLLESHPGAITASATAGWQISELSGERASTFLATTNGTSRGNLLAAATNLSGKSATTVAVVVATFESSSESTSFQAAVSMQIATQLVYVDGSISPISEPSTFGFEKDEPFGVGVFIAVRSDFPESVKSINVYRKILAIDGLAQETEYENIISAVVIGDDDEYDSPLGSTAGYMDDRDIDVLEEYDGARILKGAGPSARATTQSRALASSSGHTTSGWISDGTYYHFIATSVVVNGALTVTADDGTDDYKTTSSNVTMLMDSRMSSQAFSVLFGQEGLIRSNPFSYNDGPSIYTIGLSNAAGTGYAVYWDKRLVKTTHMPNAGVTTGVNIYGANESATANGWSYQHAGYYDRGAPAPFTYRDITGVDEEEISTVLPVIAKIIGGRMICLNVNQDNTERTSRMAYSEFRKYGIFSESNYIDFDTRSGGYGVGLGAFKSRALVLLSDSVYIIDMSGGSDLSWRELGAYPGIYAYGIDQLVETQFGVFFGAEDGVYMFDGQSVENITALPQREVDVTKTYRAMVDVGVESFCWRPDMRQLWVCSGKNVLVFDMSIGSWHKHYIQEMPVGNWIVGIETGDDQSMVGFMSAQGVSFYDFTSGLESVPFTWGIDTGKMSMGSSEFIKKTKKAYVGYSGTGTPISDGATGDVQTFFDLSVNDLPALDVEVDELSGVIRTSISSRSYNPQITLYSRETVAKGGTPYTGGDYWNGTIESFGISFKPKRLK